MICSWSLRWSESKATSDRGTDWPLGPMTRRSCSLTLAASKDPTLWSSLSMRAPRCLILSAACWAALTAAVPEM